MTAYVYRCYDADGLLLYVGCAFNPKRRIATHLRSTKTLASHALHVLLDRYEVEGPYPTREEAEAAERTAIESEGPLLNWVHSRVPIWLQTSRVADYLTERDIPLEAVGLRRCPDCDMLRLHHSRGECGWCLPDDEAVA